MNLNLGNPVVSLSCVTVGTIIIALVLQRWWHKSGGKKGEDGAGGRKLSTLVPFALALCYGILVILASPSISVLGTIGKLGLWGGKGIGYAYLVWGIGGSSPDVARATPVVLSSGGYCVLGIWTALVIGHHVWSKRMPRLYSLCGTTAGMLIGTSAGVAGIAAVPLASAVNFLGSWYTGMTR
ncbi:hypothetical protein V2S66_32950 [Streptomyces sp. V4-01]|uniref:Uncharacterized protein n=1 Tax=Actinacidiphila polyblastidii TaxID=3110430 RepID=A0ABU7PLW5_9ACTN|nr:hypothetical protein [Streptomyces sp. V4-01]